MNQTKLVKNKYTGRYGGVRSITCEDGDLYIQRDGGMKLKLLLFENNFYEMTLPEGMMAMNKLPKIRFDYDENEEIVLKD